MATDSPNSTDRSSKFEPAEPVGQGAFVVEQGDCMSSIAYEHGFFWKTLWALPENADVKKHRVDPNMLLPGDRVHIPERRLRTETRVTAARHRFVQRGVPEKLRIALLDSRGQPRKSLPYLIVIEGIAKSGTTDSDGTLTVSIPPNAKRGELVVRESNSEENEERYALHLGEIDPASALSGVQARLNNLGFRCRPTKGEMTEETVKALEAFQENQQLPVTGKLDDDTRDRLVKVHGF